MKNKNKNPKASVKGCRIQPSLTLVDVCRQKYHNNPADASVLAHKSQLKMANHRNTLRWATPSLTGSIKPTDSDISTGKYKRRRRRRRISNAKQKCVHVLWLQRRNHECHENISLTFGLLPILPLQTFCTSGF